MKRVGPATFTYGRGDELVFTVGADGKVEHLFLGMYAAKKFRVESRDVQK